MYNLDYEQMGKRIRTQRKAVKYSQSVLAQKSGISLSFLGHIERGSRKASIETLFAIANVLGLSLDFICGNTAHETAGSKNLFDSIRNALNELESEYAHK